MKEAEKGIRLCHHGRQREIQGVGWGADPHYHRRRWHPVTAPPAISTPATWNCPTSGGSTVYSIREFAERLEQTGGMGFPCVPPCRTSAAVLPSSDEIIIVVKGESGYYRTDKYGHDRAEALEIVSECNERGGVTKDTDGGNAGRLPCFGWEVPAADPKKL